MHCELCPDKTGGTSNSEVPFNSSVRSAFDGTSFCQKCVYLPTNIYEDKVFLENVRPISYLCSAILPTVYVVGLWFTLRTHVSQIYENTARKRESTFSVISEDADHSHSGHNAPNWGRTKSTAILLISTVLFSLLAGNIDSKALKLKIYIYN
jgi:Ca2+:H+ antiporter